MAEEMRLEKELTVGVPLDRAWRALSDVKTFAASLPQADLQPADGDYTGRVTLGGNGRQVVCETTVRSIDQDDDEHSTTILLHARQLDGPGIGSVTLRSRCQAANGSTKVELNAEVVTSGHEQAGPTLERTARELFDQLASRIEEQAASAPAAEPAAASAEHPSSSAEEPSGQGAPAAVSKAGAALAQQSPESRLAMVLAGVLTIVLLRWLLGRRRGGPW